MTKESDLKKMRNKGDIRGLGKVAQREKDQRISSMAASMLTDMVLDGYNRQTMFELFASLLERPHLRACAIIGLGRLKDPRAVDLLVNAFIQSPDLAMQIAFALGESIRYATSIQSETKTKAIDLLSLFLMEDDLSVSGSAAIALRNSNWKPDTDERAIRFYVRTKQYYACSKYGLKAIDALIKELFEINPADNQSRYLDLQRTIIQILDEAPATEPKESIANVVNIEIIKAQGDAFKNIVHRKAIEKIQAALSNFMVRQ